MFGMGKGEEEAPEAFLFDMEKDLMDAGKKRELKESVEERVQLLKTLLRQGEDKEAFDSTQTLLHGFLAAQKVMERASKQ